MGSLMLALTVDQVHAEEDVQKMLTAGLQGNPELFELAPIPKVREVVNFEMKLGKKALKLSNGDEFDGFRFTVPKGAGELDFVWYFNAPSGWGNWYLCPVKGEVEQSFRDWLTGDKIYQELDVVNAEGRLRVLQKLSAGYFRSGREYIMWFRRGEGVANGSLSGRLAFVGPEDDWDHEGIEKALKLKPRKAEDQVATLGSTGGKILLDEGFFTKGYAEHRIDSVFFSLRQTQQMSGGFFVTIETAIPPCKTDPSYADIRSKYGEADFVQSSKEVARVRKHAGGTPEDEGEDVTTYYYDYFGFKVANDDEKQTVLQVVTHANNYSSIRPDGGVASFAQIAMKNLTIFHMDGKEVGRMFYFLEGTKEPLAITYPPEGRYERENQVLESLGGGRWNWITHDENDRVARKVPFVENRMEGKAQGFFDDGSPRFIANYKAGVLDGEVIQYSEAGEVERKQVFKDGEVAEP